MAMKYKGKVNRISTKATKHNWKKETSNMEMIAFSSPTLICVSMYTHFKNENQKST